MKYIFSVRIFFTLVCLLLLFLSATAQWQRMNNGPCGGYVKSLLVNGSHVLAATSSYYNGVVGDWGGVYLSNGNGSTWTKTGNLPNSDVNVLMLKDSIVFAGTDSGMYVTSNNGFSWNSANGGLPAYTSVNTLINNGTDIFTITYWGISYTSDNGASWNAFTHTAHLIYGATIAVSGNNLFAGSTGNTFSSTPGGLYLTTDHGTTWDTLLFDSSVSCLATSGSTLYAGVNGNVLFSGNNGTSWTKVLSQVSPQRIILSGSKIFVISSKEMYLSENNGNSWSTILSTPDFPVTSLAFRGSEIYAGTYSGVLLSTDNGVTWNATNNGLNNVFMNYMYANDSVVLGSNFIGSLFFSTTGGTSWLPAKTGGKQVTLRRRPAGSGNDLLAITGNGDTMVRSSDYGKSWALAGLQGKYLSSVLAFGSDFFATDYDSLYRSSDKGITWTTVSGIKFLESLAANNTYLFGGNDGDGIYISSDQGHTWTASSLNNNDTIDMDIYKRVQEVKVIGPHVFARDYYGKIYLSHDNGATWILFNPSGVKFLSLETSGNNLFAATNNGVYFSVNYGATWNVVNTGIATQEITSVAVNSTQVFAGTKGYGVWKRPLGEFTALGINEKEPGQSRLLVYPNPSDGTFNIDLNSYTGVSEITIMNTLGETIYAGSCSGSFVTLNPGHIREGVYFLKVQTSGGQQTSRIIIR